MSISRVLKACTAAALCIVTASAHAQPKFVHVSGAADIQSSGDTAVGAMLDSSVHRQIFKFTRGQNNVLLGPSVLGIDGSLNISDPQPPNGDFFLSGGIYNGMFGQPYWPPSNPSLFGDYSGIGPCCNGASCTITSYRLCTGVIRYVGAQSCSPNPCSDPIPTTGGCCNPTTLVCTVTTQAACIAPNYWIGGESCGNYPCSHGHSLPFRYSSATNSWTNCGSFPNVGGQGAAKCDGTMAHPYGMSSNGRFITGGGEYGSFGTTACNTRGFVYDNNDGSFRILPPVGTGCQVFTQAEFVSTSGLVVMGTDSHDTPDHTFCNARCVTVWERSSTTSDFLASGRTVLDDYGAGGLGSAVMNRAGTVVAAGMSDGTAAVLGDPTLSRNLFKYVKNTTTGAWDRVNIGRCVDRNGDSVACMTPFGVSDDGNTIVGQAQYGGCGFFGGEVRFFIWKPTLNEGVPMDLEDYFATLPGGGLGGISLRPGISADGNAVLAALAVPAPPCPEGTGLQGLSQSGILYLDGSGVACEQPRIVGGPYSVVQSEYTPFGIVGNVFFTGSAPMTAIWQKETPSGSNNWVNLTDSCGTFGYNNASWNYEGTSGFQLRVNMLAQPAIRDGRYRVVLSNACGTATSQVADISVVSGACCYNSGGSIVCSIELPTLCTSTFFVDGGGVYVGDNTTCSPTACDAIAGACCYNSGGIICVVDVSTHCTAPVSDGGNGGAFVSSGSTCTPTACNAVAGACCYSLDNYSSAVCTVELSSRCTTNVASGGVAGAYLGNGTTCGPSACASVAGACCYAPSASEGVICTIQTQTRCTNLPQLPSQSNYFSGLQGIYVGNGATCSPSDLCSVVSGACCYSTDDTSNSICTIQLQDKCTRNANNNGLGGAYKGDSTTCTPTACNNVTGACCYSTFDNSTTLYCTIQPANRCNGRFFAGGLFGYYMGANTTCSPTACTAVVGACCYIPPNEQCYVCAVQPKDQTGTGSLRCTEEFNGGLGGTFAGVNTVCTPSNCNLQSGACCLGGSCTVICVSICTANAGDYRGDNTTCSPDPCGAPEACCAANGSCTLVAAASCIGTPMGSGSTCTPNACPGACCCGSHCSITTAVACVGTGKRFVGGGTACTPYSLSVPCCRGDYNKNAVGASISVQDIFDFLTGYFSVDTCADSNDSGTVSVQDIFDFLSAYFGGC